MDISTTAPSTTITEHEIAAEVEHLGDAAILGAARDHKQATVPAPQQGSNTVRGWSFSGSID